MWKCYRCGPTYKYYGTVQYLLYYTRATDWSRPTGGLLTHLVHTGALGGAGGGDARCVVVVCACVCVSTRPRSLFVYVAFSGGSLLRAAEPVFNVGKARNGRCVWLSLAASEHPTMLLTLPRLMATHAHTARTRTSILGCFHIRADYCLWAAAARREAPRRSSHRLWWCAFARDVLALLLVALATVGERRL